MFGSKTPARALGNLRASSTKQTLIMITSAVVVLVSGAGITARPFAKIEEMEARAETALERAGEHQSNQRVVDEFRVAHGFEYVAEAHALVERLYPSSIERVSVYGAVRLTAELLDLDLYQIQFGSSGPSGLEVLENQLELHELQIAGNGELGALLELLVQLESAGYPHVVQRATFSRPDAQTRSFQFFLSLGLFCSVPVPVEFESDGDPNGWEEGEE